MNENYIVFNGKKIELTEEQAKALGIKLRKNPFERVAKLKLYCYIDSFNEIHCVSDEAEQHDDMSFECSNYFNDYSFANQVALHQLLYRKLLKFAYDNKREDTEEWNGNNCHFCIVYDSTHNKYDVWGGLLYKMSTIYFSSREGAERAIHEVVEPFVKKHPDFVW